MTIDQYERLSGTNIMVSGLPKGARTYALDNITSQSGGETARFSVSFQGKEFRIQRGSWKTSREGMSELIAARRLDTNSEGQLGYVRYFDDFPFMPLLNSWSDTVGQNQFGSFGKKYVVQTALTIMQRCLLMTTDPGDLVLDPTCGSGTMAYVAEQWGRRWITIDASRVPLALARERLLTATFRWYRLRNETLGPAGGFEYRRQQDSKGREVGGIVPRITLQSIANREPAGEEVISQRPEADESITRVTGPFVVEATLPAPHSLTDESTPVAPTDEPGDHIARMIDVLRRAPILALPGNRKVALSNIRRPGRSLSLSAEAAIAAETEAGDPLPVAILFGPADGPVTAKAVLEAAKEANLRNYRHLLVIGFAISADARSEIEAGEDLLGLPATYVTATMDLQMGDLLKNQRSSQIFAVCGLPEIEHWMLPEPAENGTPRWQVRLLGLDVFDPVTMTTDHRAGTDVPAWMLDTNWNGMAFCAEQVFFPRTSAWENLRKALKSTHEESVWEHLAGDTSAPFAVPVGTEIAVKVLDDRGNELPVIRRLTPASASPRRDALKVAAE